MDVAAALAHIRDYGDGILYRRYGTFEAYCRDRWELKASYTQRLLDAARVVEILPMGKNAVRPSNERQVRPLSLLAEPGDQREAWLQAIKEAGDRPVTGKIVEASVKNMIKEGAVRKTAKRKTSITLPAKGKVSKYDLLTIQQHLDEIRRLTEATSGSEEVAKVIAQIEQLLQRPSQTA